MTAPATQQPGVSMPAKAGQIELILAQLDALPTRGAVAVRLLEVAADDRSGAAEITGIIETDHCLAARLLSLARRAHLGVTVETVDRAVVLLGFEAVRNLALSVQVIETFAKRMEKASCRLDWTGFWKHSLAVGCAARLLAEQLPRNAHGGGEPAVNAETAFVCGLLHDLGKVVLSVCFPKSYDRVIAQVEDRQGGINETEEEIFGIDHTQAGQRLALHWKLPAMIGECIWLHHHTPASTPTRIEYSRYVQLVQLADRLVREMCIGYSGNYAFEVSSADLAAEFGLPASALDKVRSAMPDMLEMRAELIGLERLTSKEIFTDALAKANLELARMNESLALANQRLRQRSRCFEAINTINRIVCPEPTHEEVCRLAVNVLRPVVPAPAVAVLAGSAARWSAGVLAAARAEKSEIDMEVLPDAPLVQVKELAETARGWLAGDTLPGALQDRLRAALGVEARWWWPIRHQRHVIGILAVTADAQPPDDESLVALSDCIGAWLHAAEDYARYRQLNEELSRMNRRLVAAQAEVAKMRSLAMVADLAAGAAHELNNPLAVISGRAQLLMRGAADEDVQRSAGLIAEHAHRASAIVEELMDFAKPAQPQASVWSLPELLARIRRAWLEKNTLKEEQFQLQLSDDLPPVHADAAQIEMLFDEVIRNALEAMRDVEEPLLLVNCRPDLADERIVIKVQDNGCGMNPQVLEQATTPFFSHRPAGRGRGLGLSRAARYAQINGGRLRLSSKVNGGTAVLIELPAAGR